MKYWEIIADNLSKGGFSSGCVSAIDAHGRTMWILDAHGYGKRLIVRADEKLTAFLERNQRFATRVVELNRRFTSPISDSACYQPSLSGSICAAAHPLPTALNLAALMSTPHRELERPRL